VPQFKVLRRLLFWHGRSFGVRFSNFVKWFLYKNMNTSFFSFWFNLQNGFSGSSNYDDIYYALYEITCTGFAIFIYFIFDQGIDHRLTGKEKEMNFKLSNYYQHCKTQVLEKTTLHYWFWCLWSFVSCIVIYFIPQYAFNEEMAWNGKKDGLYAASFVSVSIMVIVHHGILCIATRNFTWWIAAWYILSFFLYFPVTVFLNNVTLTAGIFMGTFSEVMRSAPFWLSLVLSSALLLLPYYVVHVVWYRLIYPQYLPDPLSKKSQ